MRPPLSISAKQAEGWMARAISLGQEAGEQGEVPVGAVVVLHDAIIAEAHNEVEKRGDATAHAELLALQRAAAHVGHRFLEEAVLCVTLEPCPMCVGACLLARIGGLVFGALDPKAGAVESLYRLGSDKRLNHRFDVVSGLGAEVCGNLLRDFFRSLRSSERGRGS